MAVVNLTYEIPQDSGVATSDGKKFTQTAHLQYKVGISNPATDTSQVVGNTLGVPFVGALHPFIPFMRAIRVNIRRTSVLIYTIDVDYESRGKPGQSPLDEPPDVTFDFAASEHAFDIDVNGMPIVMVTGEQFDPPIREQYFDQTVRVSRNLAWVDPNIMSIYAGAVNADNFLGLPPGCVRITEPPKASSKQWDSFTYFQASIGFTIRRIPQQLQNTQVCVNGQMQTFSEQFAWYRRVLASGFYVYVPGIGPIGPAGQKPQRFVTHATDGKGKDMTKPVLHDAVSGALIPDDPTTKKQDPSKAQWYAWQIFPSLPFAALQVV